MVYVAWLLWAAVAMAATGVLVARRQRPSTIAAAAILVAATVLMAFVGTTPSGVPMLQSFVSSNAAGLAETRLQAAQLRSQQLAEQLEQARVTEERAKSLVSSLRPAGPSPSPAGAAIGPTDPTSRQFFLVAALAVLLISSGALLLLVNGSADWTLRIGKDARRDEQLAALEQLAGLVWAKRYRDAVAKGTDISELRLRQSEMLDLFYLRSYAAVQVYAFPEKGEAADDRRSLLEAAVRDLTQVVEVVPRRGQALYLLALAHGLAGRDDEALAFFERARTRLKGDTLPFAHNQSVCLLRRAEQHLSVGDTQAAEVCFGQVANLGKLGSSIVHVRVKIGLIELRGAMGKQASAAAQAALGKIKQFAGLTTEQRATIDVIGIEVDARAALARGEPARAAAEAERFVSAYLPKGLPPLDDDVVNEDFSPLLDSDLAFPRAIYSGILFILAVARCLTEAKEHKALTEAEVARIAEPLLRGLQILPRDRELLASIGGLYYWTRRDLRPQARAWVESAVTMGVESRYARLILAQDKAEEANRRGVLDLFRSASVRFLRDPALAGEMRRALVEELSRFQEFEPMLISLQDRPDYEPEEPTVTTLQDRARYLSALVESEVRRGRPESHARLGVLRDDYARSLGTLEQSARSLEALGRQVMGELSSLLVLR